MTSVLIVDDHPLFRDAVQIAIRSAAPTAEIHEATEIDAAEEMIAGHRRGYDVALVDLTMPGTTGFDGIARLRRRFPSLPILVISAHDDPAIVREAMTHGVAGFVSKTANKGEIARAIEKVLQGGTHLPAGMTATRAQPRQSGEADLTSRVASLTPQQLKVLQMLRQGKLNKQIAHELDVGETTVKAHVSEILRKLGVFSRTQAVIEAAKVDLAQFVEPMDGGAARR